ncbi:MAG: DUF1080 domain-containing protein [Verrucomicrobiales bacterium]|nr:DUF1080 domain-containing protein [Verrucomicrobiales bacterium]
MKAFIVKLMPSTARLSLPAPGVSSELLIRRRVLLMMAAGLMSCGPRRPRSWDLLSAEWLPHWSAAGIEGEGAVTLSPGSLRLEQGQPMTGARFSPDWQAAGLPLIDYAISFEARRVEGRDFFATLTFPVGELDRCLSWVVGGWGGTVVGISSVDHADASENSTRGEMAFEQGRWYRLRLEVRQTEVSAWIDDRPMVRLNLKGHHLGLRSGDIERTAPLGFATWMTVGEVRSLRLTLL